MSYVLTINLVNNCYLTIASADTIVRADIELFMENCEEDLKLEVRSHIPIPIDVIQALSSYRTASRKVLILERKDVLRMNLSIL